MPCGCVLQADICILGLVAVELFTWGRRPCSPTTGTGGKTRRGPSQRDSRVQKASVVELMADILESSTRTANHTATAQERPVIPNIAKWSDMLVLVANVSMLVISFSFGTLKLHCSYVNHILNSLLFATSFFSVLGVRKTCEFVTSLLSAFGLIFVAPCPVDEHVNFFHGSRKQPYLHLIKSVSGKTGFHKVQFLTSYDPAFNRFAAQKLVSALWAGLSLWREILKSKNFKWNARVFISWRREV